MTTPIEKLPEMILAQEALLRSMADGTRTPLDSKDEYLGRHAELRNLLQAAGLPCYCPWNNVWAWSGRVAQVGAAWPAELAKLRAPFAAILGTAPVPPAWKLQYLDEFIEGFVASLSQVKQIVLDRHLKDELAVSGLTLLENRQKLESVDCRRGGNIFEYKIQTKSSDTEFKLRIFLDTAPGNVLVLLHGFDKGANDSKAYQSTQIEVACGRR
jgi:hypothetical protein